MTATTARALPMDDTVEQVVLVDDRDRPVGLCDKLEAHRRGVLHRAFSVFLFDSGGRMLLQRRAAEKYHSAGAWANSCCGHPRHREDDRVAAERRTFEELGIHCPLTPAGTHVYRASVGPGLVEHEYVHLFVGRFDGSADPEPAEVAETAWMTPQAIRAAIAERPEQYSAWLRAYAGCDWFPDLGRRVRATV
jgi:isopentenyl-diphosphate delta-isomerase